MRFRSKKNPIVCILQGRFPTEQIYQHKFVPNRYNFTGISSSKTLAGLVSFQPSKIIIKPKVIRRYNVGTKLPK